MELYISISKEGRIYPPDDVDRLSEFSLKHAEGVYKLKGMHGWFVIDNKDGLGNTPNNQNVLYKGCMAIMNIDTLLYALPDIDKRDRDSYQMVDLLKQGESIASPFLDINIDLFVENEEGVPMFVGHEGRARTLALKKLGVKELPVQLQFIGYRARHVENRDAFKQWLNKGVKL
jgi:hypothetical protein